MNYRENMPCFSDMLNSEYPMYDEFATPTPSTYVSRSLEVEESVPATPFTSQVVSSQTVKDKRTRTKNFTKQEDELLISAWQNITFDGVTGVDQTNESYWGKIHKYFMMYKDFSSDRSSNSLMHRWSVIQLAVSKFQGFYSQVDGRSGYSEDDKIRCAKDMYREVTKCSFSVEHCWKILRYSPKWNLKFGTKKSKVSLKDNPIASSSPTIECVTLENTEFERPMGRKAAKEMQKKRKRMENENDDAAILEQMRADQIESKKQRNEQLKEIILLAKEKAARDIERDEREKRREAHEQDEADARIMAIDTSSMGAIEVEYFNSRKQEIIERRRNRSLGNYH